MDNNKAGNGSESPAGIQLHFPFHVDRNTHYEVTDIDGNLTDPKRAHEVAGDPSYQVRLPKTCGSCAASALAKAAYTSEVPIDGR